MGFSSGFTDLLVVSVVLMGFSSGSSGLNSGFYRFFSKQHYPTGCLPSHRQLPAQMLRLSLACLEVTGGGRLRCFVAVKKKLSRQETPNSVCERTPTRSEGKFARHL